MAPALSLRSLSLLYLVAVIPQRAPSLPHSRDKGFRALIRNPGAAAAASSDFQERFNIP